MQSEILHVEGLDSLQADREIRVLSTDEIEDVSGGIACGGVCIAGAITAGGFALGLGTSYAVNNWL